MIKKTKSFDQLEIVYSIQGRGEAALVFIHGGFGDRSFWKDQLPYFCKRFQVIALDLGGHGESGDNRKEWNLTVFARDVLAVIKAEGVQKAILIGNSLGGPVALRAYALKIMLNHSPGVAVALTESFIGFDMGKLVKGLKIPIRCINGDIYPTPIEKNREFYPDFNAIILPKTGHYPMLENPGLFNRSLDKILKELTKK